MATNFYQVTKTINNKEYTAQFNGISAALQAIDNSYIEGSNNTSLTKLSKYLLENVLISPKGLTVDDFDSMDEFNELISFLRQVMQGDFREKKDKEPAKKASTK